MSPAVSSNLENSPINLCSKAYVRLVLSMEAYDPDIVDAYYGPQELREGIKQGPITALADLKEEADKILADLGAVETAQFSNEECLRHRYLTKQTEAALAKIEMLSGVHFSFDQEAQKLYDTAVPAVSESYFQQILQSLESLIPGTGELSDRVNKFKRLFVIPPEKVDQVFQAALDEARIRTSRYIVLPSSESFLVEYVTGVPWEGYNWYKGNYKSVIQVNLDNPILINRVIDLACHEGYPGHHVYNIMLEQKLVNERKWGEFAIYPLFSPQSLISEGTANYGIQLAFPGSERIEFEQQLLSAAGIGENDIKLYYRVMTLAKELETARIEAARNFIDQRWTVEQTLEWLRKYTLMTTKPSEQHLGFIQKYRSHVINYSIGEKLVADYVEGGSVINYGQQERWSRFIYLLSTPQVASNLRN
jgi:hypothetical protein